MVHDPRIFLHQIALPPGTTGIPLAVKDNIDVAGMPTTAGCPSFAYQPAADAPVVGKLRAAGYVPMGKTNLDQFATGLVGTRSPAGMPDNPAAPGFISGGSSSGSGVAVAAGLVPVALGTDTAGSGRIPAAFGNIVGIKPTKGWLSTRGVVPAVRSLDCVSVFALTVAEAWRATTLAAGFDGVDVFSRQRPGVTLPGGSLRIGVPTVLDDVDPAWRAGHLAAQEILRGLGHQIVTVDFSPFAAAASLLYGGAWVAERTAAVGDFLDREPADADPVVSRIIRGGRNHDALAAWRGTYELARLHRLADAQWERMDVLLLPTACRHPTPADVAADPVGVNSALGRFTNFANLLDTSAIALPVSYAGGVPVGITLFAPAWHDPLLARLGAAFQDATALPLGATGRRLTAPQDLVIPDDGLVVAVFGAHLQGEPLHQHLLSWGARLVGPCRTAPIYRCHRLPGAIERPGLVRVETGGGEFSGELYRMSPEALGRLVASVAPPLGLGTVILADRKPVIGFICEAIGVVGTPDITDRGSWRNR